MTEPRDHFVRSLDRECTGRRRPAQHDHFDAECARRRDLAVGRGPAAIFGDHRIDIVRAHEGTVIGRAERAAIGEITRARQGQRRFDRIDAADEIEVLWRCGQRDEFGAAERDKGPARRLAQPAHGIGDINCFDPAIPGNSAPCRPAQRNQRHARLMRRGGGICRDDIRVGMGRVDKGVDPFLIKIFAKTDSAAEAAAANRRRLWRRRLGAAGERHDDFEIGARGQARGQFSRFRRTAEDKDA